MRCFHIKIENDSDRIYDGAISAEIMILAEDFVGATMKTHEVLEEFRRKLSEITEGTKFARDLDTLRVVEIRETCRVVIDGIGQYGNTFRHGIQEAVDSLTAKIEKQRG